MLYQHLTCLRIFRRISTLNCRTPLYKNIAAIRAEHGQISISVIISSSAILIPRINLPSEVIVPSTIAARLTSAILFTSTALQIARTRYRLRLPIT